MSVFVEGRVWLSVPAASGSQYVTDSLWSISQSAPTADHRQPDGVHASGPAEGCVVRWAATLLAPLPVGSRVMWGQRRRRDRRLQAQQKKTKKAGVRMNDGRLSARAAAIRTENLQPAEAPPLVPTQTQKTLAFLLHPPFSKNTNTRAHTHKRK